MKIKLLSAALASVVMLTSPAVFAQATSAASAPGMQGGNTAKAGTDKASHPPTQMASAPAEKKPAKAGAQAGPASTPK
jgi:hypothetical protein